MVYKPLPIEYRKSSPVLANYSYEDIASGSGIVQFKGFDHESTTLSGANLITSSIYSENIYTTFSIPNSASTKLGEIDFDVLMNSPRVIKGDVIVNLPVKVTHNFDSMTYYLTITLRKYDGTTETDIGTATTITQSLVGGSGEEELFVLKIPVASNTQIKEGEYIRVTIEAYGGGSNGSGTLDIAHDPAGRTYSTLPTTTLSIYIPFNLEV